MTATPPPAAPVNIEECWVEVQDKASGQMYWWNTATNETTAVGAPKPTGASAVGYPQQQSGGMMRGLGSVVAEGFAFGAGSAVAHNVVGSFSVEVVTIMTAVQAERAAGVMILGIFKAPSK